MIARIMIFKSSSTSESGVENMTNTALSTYMIGRLNIHLKSTRKGITKAKHTNMLTVQISLNRLVYLCMLRVSLYFLATVSKKTEVTEFRWIMFMA